MKQIEIAMDDLAEVEILGENPMYRFEEILNETNQNDLSMILRGYLRLDIEPDEISDYEIKDDTIILFTGDEVL